MASRTPRQCLALAALFLTSLTVSRAQISLQLVADNDFALFAGSATSITRVAYQNEFWWGAQTGAAATASFELQAGETTLYLLALGGGGGEDVSGRINGVNIADIFLGNPAAIESSSNLAGLLSGYDSNSISAGTFTVSAAELHAILPLLTWGAPTVSTTGVIAGNPFAFSETENGPVGFSFPGNEARLFRFSVEAVNLNAIPEPTTAGLALAAAAFAFAGWWRHRRCAPAS